MSWSPPHGQIGRCSSYWGYVRLIFWDDVSRRWVIQHAFGEDKLCCFLNMSPGVEGSMDLCGFLLFVSELGTSKAQIIFILFPLRPIESGKCWLKRAAFTLRLCHYNESHPFCGCCPIWHRGESKIHNAEVPVDCYSLIPLTFSWICLVSRHPILLLTFQKMYCLIQFFALQLEISSIFGRSDSVAPCV